MLADGQFARRGYAQPEKLLPEPGLHLHLYGKASAKSGRNTQTDWSSPEPLVISSHMLVDLVKSNVSTIKSLIQLLISRNAKDANY